MRASEKRDRRVDVHGFGEEISLDSSQNSLIANVKITREESSLYSGGS